jgi:hypothetical protein
MLFSAIAKAGVRAIISAGWAGLGKGKETASPDVLVWSSAYLASSTYWHHLHVHTRGRR